MKKLQGICRSLLVLLACLLTFSAYAEVPQNIIKEHPNLTVMLKSAMPAVVNIYVQGQLPPGHYPIAKGQKSPNPYQQQMEVPRYFQDYGSGVIVDAHQGYILTNAHVIRDAQSIIVTLNDGRRFHGQIIGADNLSDIAVIKINADNLSALPFADSDKVQVGDFVAAIGSPFGLLTQTVTSGVVSALNRDDLGIEGYENFIQTDASINPGNSGGALVNMQGQLVGINTAILAPSGGNIGIGFAIPSNMSRSVMEQLIKYGKVERGLLGVVVQDLTPDLADALNAHGVQGALVTQINPGTPAAKAGLQVKDIVVKINGKPITSAAQLRTTVGLMRVGSNVSLEVLRNNKTLQLNAETMPQQKVLSRETINSLLAGVRLRNYSELNFNAQQVRGIEVVDLDENSAAALKGLRPGDVILTANGQQVADITQLLDIANKNSKRLLLEIQRNGSAYLFMVIDNN